MNDVEKLKLRLFNVKFSPNLGDGLLAECLEGALLAQGADADIRSIDLAGRTDFGETMAGRALAMRILGGLPATARRRLVMLPLALKARRTFRPHYAAALEGADAVVIGGGNLVTDVDLNFPTKLALAMDEARRRRLPVVFFAVGVGRDWSRAALARMREALGGDAVKAVLVRDEASRAAWDENFAAMCGHRASVVRDPGLLACDHYPSPPHRGEGRGVVGLGLMSPLALRYHGKAGVTKRALDRWYLDLARHLLAAGYRVTAFTNGSTEDRAYADGLGEALEALGRRVTLVRQDRPAGLVAHIARCDAIVAFRMHAIIAAYSCGVPAVALAWDRKLDAFMASVGRSAWLHDVATLGPAACAALLARAMREGVPEPARRKAVAEARADVGRALRALRDAVPEAGAPPAAPAPQANQVA